MALTIKNFFSWCKRHLLLVTLAVVAAIVVFGFVNIQILHMTSEPEFCAMCHPQKGRGPLAEVDSWEHSAHGEAGVSCLDCHGRPGVVGYVKAKLGGLKDTYMQLTISAEEKLQILSNPDKDLVPVAHCLFCHSDKGNQDYRQEHKYSMKLVEMRMLDDVVNPDFRLRKGLPDIMQDDFVGGTHFNHAFHMESFDFICRDCHFGITHDPMSKTERMNVCVACHTENKESSAPQLDNCVICHQAQVDMNKGVGAIGVTGEPGLMTAAGITCQECHTAVAQGLYRPSASTCTNCHDDSYVDVFKDWSQETKETQEQLQEMRITVEDALKEADKVKRDTAAPWALYQKGLSNLKLVRNDGTHGVHNRDYAEAILKSVEADFKKVLQSLERTW